MNHNLPKCLWLCLALTGATAGHAQTDVTEQYLVNPSFEADAASCTTSSPQQVTNNADGLRGWNLRPQGWSITSPGVSLLISSDCFTDNNFGKTSAADGMFAFYQRFGWGSASSELKQTSTRPLPAGHYKLEFHTKAFAANGAATGALVTVTDSKNATLESTAFNCDAGTADVMATSLWKKQSLTFELKEESTVTVSSQMTWGNGGSCIVYDDFRLTELPEGYEEPKEPTIIGGTEDEVPSPTEGVITHRFTPEDEMMQDLLQMLANSLTYARNIWFNCSAPNSKNETCGFFKANSAGNSNEDGVRTNADFSMICAFLYKYAQGKVTLPAGITWNTVKDMAMKSLVFGYSTHKANKFKVTSNNAYWGSVSTSDNVWESSLWAMSLAYASHFLSDELTATQKQYIYNMVKAECNYELNRSVPTGYNGDTKAEENGWEADILACALGLYPDDALAPKWFDRLRLFAINSYSQVDDADDDTVIDPEYDDTTVKDLYKGKNLYDDYTLQNHNYFHTSYQNVVMQELGEAQLALALFQGANAKWKTNALMHNNREVMDEVLCQLALADGELAMPNGNDWSMFLYDQITSYATAACFLRDPNALMLENMAYKYIKARQTTTPDGSWMLNSDIGPRRMGVEGHRVMMTYLMHEMESTADLTPTSWEDFSRRFETAKLFTTQNIVRANTKDRFTVFSWSTGLNSYTGYIAANNPDKNKIISPYKANNTGNLLGWYTVSGKGTNASPLVNGVYNLMGNSYTMNGKLSTNDNTLENNFTLYSTPGNAVIYMDYVTGRASGTITREQGGLLAISTDPFTKEKRTLYYADGRQQTDGKQLLEFKSQWVNIDNQVGIVSGNSTDNHMAFGDYALSNSIGLSKIYPLYSTRARAFQPGSVVDRRSLVYYSNTDSATTACLAEQMVRLTDSVPTGWNGVICADPDNAAYLLLSNYTGETSCRLQGISLPQGAPVFTVATTIENGCSEATFKCDVNHSVANVLRTFVSEATVNAKQVAGDSCSFYMYNPLENMQEATVCILTNGQQFTASVPVQAGECVRVSVQNGTIVSEITEIKEGEEDFKDITAGFLVNPSFEEDQTWGTTGSLTLNGTVYNPCYINKVAAVNSKWPQVLPVQGWQPQNQMSGGSNYTLLYSMPYSATTYCVSPSSVGNSASIMAAPAQFDSCGTRCLSVLNSWDKGSNAITQTVNLPAGEYRLTFVMQYVCPNESRHRDDCITTNDNENYSLCGISIGDSRQFHYPATANNWERITCPFTLTETTDVTVSMGLRTTAGVGAANNTRLYIDDVRLLQKKQPIADNLRDLLPSPSRPLTDVYTLQGIKIRHQVPAAQALNGLPRGIYITDGRKIVIE